MNEPSRICLVNGVACGDSGRTKALSINFEHLAAEEEGEGWQELGTIVG